MPAIIKWENSNTAHKKLCKIGVEKSSFAQWNNLFWILILCPRQSFLILEYKHAVKVALEIL